MIYTEMPEGFCPGFSAVGCFVESKGRILQLLRSEDAKVEPSKWGAPAGKVEDGETERVAMLRELAEETGLLVTSGQLLQLETVFVQYPKAQFTYTMFRVKFTYPPEVRLNLEHVAHTWIPPHCCEKSLALMRDEWDCIKLAYRL